MENKSIGVQKSQDLHGGILGTPPRNFEKTELRNQKKNPAQNSTS
jgi:hypothetical protein